MATLYVDFDGVIHDHLNVPQGRKMGPPVEGALEAIRKLKDQGHDVVIFTVRATDSRSCDVIYQWLDFFKFPYNIHVTNVKGNADFYIDDKALKFTNWTSTLNALSS